MSKTKSKLIIIDGNALIYRSFHALPPTMRTSEGKLVNAVYGFTSFLLKALNEFHPEYVVLTLDKAGPTFRHKEYKEYKATRSKAPDELYEQIPLIKKVSKAFSIPIFELSTYEADDLIGTICQQTSKEKNLEKIIITGDMDTLQLVNKQTKVYTMSRGLSDSILYDIDQVYKRYRLKPQQIIDYKALRGDPSDNIPGVKGIGEKTATELLEKFKTLDNVYQAVEKNSPEIKERYLKLLINDKDKAYLSQSLATINCQAPINFSLNKARLKSFKSEKILKLFSHLGFKSLLPRVRALQNDLGLKQDKDEFKQETITKKNNKKQVNYQLIETEGEFNAFLEKLQKQKQFNLSLETSGPDPLNSTLLGLGFSWKQYNSYFIPPKTGRLNKLKLYLENPKIKKWGHNLKFVYRVLKQHNLELQGLYFDTMIASYVLNPNRRKHDLASLSFNELAQEKLERNNSPEPSSKQLSLALKEPDLEELVKKTGENADLNHALIKIFKKKIEAKKLHDIFYDIDIPLIPVLAKMENTGIKLDLHYLNKLEKEVEKILIKLENKIHALAKTDFNINSTKQLRVILFEKLDIPTDNIKKTKTGFSTAEDELNKLHDFHPIIAWLQKYRELNKLQNTYLKPLAKLVNPKTGCLHTSFNQTITATGRLSSSDPNLQNIPTRSEWGQKIRHAFVSEPGYQLVSFDYSQIELRIAAHMANDKKMIKAFRNGIDIHQATAAEINKVELKSVNKDMRREAKAINFGILYGQGPHGLSREANIPYFQAVDFIKKYFLAYPKIKKMTEGFIQFAQKTAYTSTMFGRQRPLAEINSNIVMVRKSAERMAINTPIQGTAADIIKLAMIKIDSLIKDNEDEIKLLLQIHDELIFSIKETKLADYETKIKNIMENIVKLKVNLVVQESKGNKWSDLK